MGKTVTAYFAFSSEHRATVREELQAVAGSDQKVSVAEVAKTLGQKWRALDDAEKDRCKFEGTLPLQTILAATAGQLASCLSMSWRSETVRPC